MICCSFSSQTLKFTMSKAKLQKHIATAQKHQIKIKEKNQKYVPGTLNLQILGSGAPGAPAAVYLFTDQSRYLFNCGEGTQRLAHEHRMKLTRLEHIFVTRNSWHCIGGLPGLSLTIQDAGVTNITLHGPPKLEELFQAMQNFVILKQLQVDAPECSADDYYEDSVLRIDYVPLRKESLECNELDQAVMAFICKCKPRPGTLSLSKCLNLGVPKGPLLGKLKNGEVVILQNGTIVRPEDVCEPDDPGPIFLVIDIPTTDYLKSLCNNKRFKEYQNDALAENDRADLVLHFSTDSVVDTKEYQDFVAGFSSTTKHLNLNEKNIFSGYVAAHRLQWQLHQVNETIFPILREPIKACSPDDVDECCTKKIRLNEIVTAKCEKQTVKTSLHNFENASSMTCFYLRPHTGIDRSLETKVNPAEFIKEITGVDGVLESLENLKQMRVQAPSVNRANQYPKIVFLGTGSCVPNKTRNVSSILIHTTKDTCILLDIGEGTCGQLIRFYGGDAYDVIRKIKAIYISHLHADHHIGLFGVLQMRKRLMMERNEPILLMAPLEIKSWLTFYDNEIEAISSEFELVSNRNLIENGLPEEKLLQLGLISFRTCFVVHCPNAFGAELTINLAKPFKITYSGDTKPCNELIKLGIDSTLLIHEATMEDELYEDALAKFHSTVSQAIEQGHKMNAEYILLTHFSQRYAKIPRIEQHLVRNVGIAFDNMEVVPSDLADLNALYPTLKKVFAEHWDEMEQKSQKRAHKKAIAQSESV